MVKIVELRDYVEMFVVHKVENVEPFPEIGYIDVGPSNAEKEEQSGNAGVDEVGGIDGNEDVNEGSSGGDKSGGAEVKNGSGGEQQDEGGRAGLDSAEDSDDEEFIPSESDVDSADDIQFTDSEEDYDDDGKGVANAEFSDGEGYDSEEMEKEYEVGGGNEEKDGDSVRSHVYKTQKDMKEYGWEVGTVFA
ncbi:hypothetical protein PIB30_086694 [Stylosanthes scabra]|uniref:Uncharacterized protein n=1 Tax=Stylosanthes scabra TaxID=79078 RepID=A0ABU6USQ5_9FABA|nr:hypothetical protein [Stylosanthes scabra]